MRWRGRIGLIAVFVAALLGAAPAAFAQAVSTMPPAASPTPMPMPVLPSVTSPACVPDSTNAQTCALTPAPLPPPPEVVVIPRSVPVRPRMGLAFGGVRGGSAIGEEKVLSYFQRGGATPVDTKKAFGFVLLPKSAITEDERAVQTRFCQVMLSSLDFMTPEGVARTKALVTYWPVVSGPTRTQIEYAFKDRSCDQLIGWYDHALARAIAARADVAGMSGPLLITWPSDGGEAEARDPLIVDFARADYPRMTKALQYWFGELRQKPALWTSRIHEGTIRAELADAINDTAGVMLAVMSGKWDSVTVVSDGP